MDNNFAPENKQDNVISSIMTNTTNPDLISAIRSRKHDLLLHFEQLANSRANIQAYVGHKSELSEDDFLSGIRNELAHQEESLEHIAYILDGIDRNSTFGEPEVINIDEFLANNYFDGPNYTNDHDCDHRALAEYGFDISPLLLEYTPLKDGESWKDYRNRIPDFAEGINIYMAKDDLIRLFDNIIGNAIMHGFTNPERNDYELWTKLDVDKERNMFRIDIENNGTPLPQGIDKFHYGMRGVKSGETAGEGEGGYIVKSIVEHYGGDYDVFCTHYETSDWTTIRILLPIYNK